MTKALDEQKMVAKGFVRKWAKAYMADIAAPTRAQMLAYTFVRGFPRSRQESKYNDAVSMRAVALEVYRMMYGHPYEVRLSFNSTSPLYGRTIEYTRTAEVGFHHYFAQICRRVERWLTESGEFVGCLTRADQAKLLLPARATT